MTPDHIRIDALETLNEDLARQLSDHGQHAVATRMLGSGPPSAIPVADALGVALGLCRFLIGLGDQHREFIEGRLGLAAGELACVHVVRDPHERLANGDLLREALIVYADLAVVDARGGGDAETIH